MKTFFSENYDALRKFFMTHVVMSLLGIMVGLSIMVFEGESDSISLLAIVASVFTVGFLCFLHYDDMYFVGARHALSTKHTGEKPSAVRGLKITLLGYSPTLLVGLITIILDIATSSGQPAASALLVFYAFQGSFLSLYKINTVWGTVAYVIITLIPTIVASVMGYTIGMKEKTLRGMLGFKVNPPYDGPIPDKKRRWF